MNDINTLKLLKSFHYCKIPDQKLTKNLLVFPFVYHYGGWSWETETL